MQNKKQLPLKALDGNKHSLTISLAIIFIIISKFVEERLPLLLCTIFLILFFVRRINCLSAQVETFRKGDIEYPSLIGILDSLMLPDIICVIWGIWLIFKYSVFQNTKIDFFYASIIAMLISQIIFMIMLIVQQYFMSFFFTTCIGHGYFLFSLLPRILAATRTLLVSIIWVNAISDITVHYPVLIQFLYLLSKGVLLIIWLYDFIKMVISKEFPPEFGTKHEKLGFQCPVCLENIFFYITLPCSHHLCLTCFCRWGTLHNTCPVCRNVFYSWIHQAEFKKLIIISLIIF